MLGGSAYFGAGTSKLVITKTNTVTELTNTVIDGACCCLESTLRNPMLTKRYDF